MINVLAILITLLFALGFPRAQELPTVTEEQLENAAGSEETETEDDSFILQLEQFRQNPLQLNTAEAPELQELRLLTDLQIENLLLYRKLLGPLVSLYELQAVPSWDLYTIRKLIPYIRVDQEHSLPATLRQRLRGGEHHLLFRFSRVLEQARGYHDTLAIAYPGSPHRLFFRYRYQYKDLLQYGLLGDKDAGEQFFKGAQKTGFDFYSFHFFTRRAGFVRALALGDFTVNMGQGLLHWQSLAFKKSADVMGIKRSSPVLRPYHSAGEFYFHRGAGITLKKGSVEGSLFVSTRQLSANTLADTLGGLSYVSSFLTSGYHRTRGEIEDRHRLHQFTTGTSIKYMGKRWYLAVNGVSYLYSLPIRKREGPYNLYAIRGKGWWNTSIDFGLTYRNFHYFGEAALDKRFSMAFIQGVMISVDPKVDISILHRFIPPAYQAMYGNAFTENTAPSNETGLYTGISIRPATGLKLDAYADLYRFPWLKFQSDAPGSGNDFLLQFTCTPRKQVEIYTRYRHETKPANQPANDGVTNAPMPITRQSWRTQVTARLNGEFSLRGRVELTWYDRRGKNAEAGFMGFTDIIYRPLLKPYSALLRFQYFETGGYNSRVYAYENDVRYSFSIPALSGKGYRYYLNLSWESGAKITIWLRWASTVYLDRLAIGSGSDEIAGNRKSELKCQISCIL